VHGISTLPPGCSGLAAGAQLVVRMQEKAFNSLQSGDVFKQKKNHKQTNKKNHHRTSTVWGVGKSTTSWAKSPYSTQSVPWHSWRYEFCAPSFHLMEQRPGK